MLVQEFNQLQLEILWDEHIVTNVSPDIVARFNEQIDSLNVILKLLCDSNVKLYHNSYF